jgi:hypothetical protein
MIIKTKLNVGDRVTWFSDDYKRQLNGEIYLIITESDRLKNHIDYGIECDEIIKSQSKHIVKEKDEMANLTLIGGEK